MGSTIKKQYPKYETTIEAWIEKYGNIELAKSVDSLLKGRIEPIFKHDHEKITPANPEKEAVIKEYDKQEPASVRESDTEKEARLQKIRLTEILGGFKNIFPRLSVFPEYREKHFLQHLWFRGDSRKPYYFWRRVCLPAHGLQYHRPEYKKHFPFIEKRSGNKSSIQSK